MGILPFRTYITLTKSPLSNETMEWPMMKVTGYFLFRDGTAVFYMQPIMSMEFRAFVVSMFLFGADKYIWLIDRFISADNQNALNQRDIRWNTNLWNESYLCIFFEIDACRYSNGSKSPMSLTLTKMLPSKIEMLRDYWTILPKYHVACAQNAFIWSTKTGYHIHLARMRWSMQLNNNGILDTRHTHIQ